MPKSLFKAHLAILGSTLLFALNIPIAKSLLVTGDVHSVGLTMMRFITATAGFWLLSLFLPHERIRKNVFHCSNR
ncbi:MAG: hypothetical protein LBH91_04530 [Prevotellaceae bacterium]|nr:hypothetical protein [Prevotellaceae bacterium]